MKKMMFILGAFLIIALTGCDKEDLLQPEVKNENKSQLKSGSIYMNVPSLSQINPNTPTPVGYNCGQTCVVMAVAHFNLNNPYSPYYTNAYQDLEYSLVVDQNLWLMAEFPYDGFNTGTSTGMYTNHFRAILRYKHGLSARSYYDQFNRMLTDVGNGKPCIAAVYANSTGIVSSGGDPHWVLVRGYNPSTQKIYVNDPWDANGEGKEYSMVAFKNSWDIDKVYVSVSL